MVVEVFFVHLTSVAAIYCIYFGKYHVFSMNHTLIIFCVFEVLNLSGNLIQLATSSQGGSVQQSPNQTNQQTPAAQNSQTNLGSVVMVSTPSMNFFSLHSWFSGRSS